MRSYTAASANNIQSSRYLKMCTSYAQNSKCWLVAKTEEQAYTLLDMYMSILIEADMLLIS